jgi:hypothetical protein
MRWSELGPGEMGQSEMARGGIGWTAVVGMVVAVGMVPAMRCSGAESRPAEDGTSVVRVLDDAANGDRWELVRDVNHPGGPGRMVRREGAAVKAEPVVAEKARLVIHAGDRVAVEEKTDAVVAHLEGLATTPAAYGELVTVRLKVGGWMVRAVAEAPGKARLAVEAR